MAVAGQEQPVSASRNKVHCAPLCGRHPVGKGFLIKSSYWSGAPVCTACLCGANTTGLHALRQISSLSKARAQGARGYMGFTDLRLSTAYA
jgi:hypothetical protein